MSTSILQGQVSRRDLLQAAADLSPPELDQFVAEVRALRDMRSGRATCLSDDELIQLIRNAYPPELRLRYRELIAKRQDDSISQQEHEELIQVGDDVEARNVERIWALGQLAIRRNMTLDAMMQDLGIHSLPASMSKMDTRAR